MPTFTVHEPPPRKNESVASPERFVFVRDGFHFWAFLLPPLWFLFRRLWVALILYLIVSVALEFGMSWAKVPSGWRIVVELMLGIVIGLEAATIQRWTLARRKWKTLGFVVAEDAELAERRFLGAWTPRVASPRFSRAVNFSRRSGYAASRAFQASKLVEDSKRSNSERSASY